MSDVWLVFLPERQRAGSRKDPPHVCSHIYSACSATPPLRGLLLRRANPRPVPRPPAPYAPRVFADLRQLVGRPAADHDLAAGRTGRRIFRILDRRVLVCAQSTAARPADGPRGRLRSGIARDGRGPQLAPFDPALYCVVVGRNFDAIHPEIRRTIDLANRISGLRVIPALEPDVAELVDQRLEAGTPTGSA